MLLNIKNVNKENTLRFFRNQFLVLLIGIILGLILTYDNYSPIITVVTITILFFYSYFDHVIAHMIPKTFFNTHVLFHHNQNENTNNLQTIINWLVEFLTNCSMFLIFYIIKTILNLNFIPNIIILYYAIIYITVHNINYTIFHISENHSFHHKSNLNGKICNYGPDTLDHLFNTNYNDNFEDFTHMLPNMLFAFFILYFIFKPNNIISYINIFNIFTCGAIFFIFYKVFK
jgi:hypothetical protein